MFQHVSSPNQGHPGGLSLARGGSRASKRIEVAHQVIEVFPVCVGEKDEVWALWKSAFLCFGLRFAQKYQIPSPVTERLQQGAAGWASFASLGTPDDVLLHHPGFVPCF